MSKRRINLELQKERKKAIKEFFLSLIGPGILFLIIAAGILVIMFYQTPEPEDEIVIPKAYDGTLDPMILENEYLKLTMDPATTHFDIEVKSSGKVWHATPVDAASDSMALSSEKEKLQSNVVLTYSSESGFNRTYNSFGQSTSKGVYTIDQNPDSLKVNYSIGMIEKEYFVPPVLPKEDFDRFIEQFDKSNAALVKDYYKEYNLDKLSVLDDKDELIANYPIIEEVKVIRVLRDSVKEQQKKKFEKLFEDAGLTYEEYLDYKALNQKAASSDVAVFNISVSFKLEGRDFVVECEYDDMDYYTTSPVYAIQLIPYFGAGSTTEKGFMLVPEGGGALINFNNGKTAQNTYASAVYGPDLCLLRRDLVHDTRAYYGVFGISDLNDSFICILEDGSTYASVISDISGKTNSYNYVTAEYRLLQREQFDVGDIANSEVYEYLWELPKGEKLKQRYRFVDSGDYVDMAETYRGYLADKYGSDFKNISDSSAPFVLDIVGAVDKVKQIVGIPVSRPLELTNTDEAAVILEELVGAGITNISARYLGWCNGGVNQSFLRNVSVLSQIGGKKGIKELSKKASELGVDLYLNGITQYAYDTNIFDGFFSYLDAARFISKKKAQLDIYSSVTYAAREGVDPYYLLDADVALDMIDNLAEQCEKYNTGIAFEEVGKDLSADYSRGDFKSRETVKALESEKVKNLSDAGKKIMINMGNDYEAFYTDMIANMDLKGSDYTILDVNVPFFQIATHGHLRYTGEPINICGDSETEILLAAEYGAGLHYTLMDESSFTLQDSLYTRFYGCEYDAWKDNLLDVYKRFNSELGHTFNQEIVDHVKLVPEVSCTTYADGTKVYVNYKFLDYTLADGTVLPARDYKVIR